VPRVSQRQVSKQTTMAQQYPPPPYAGNQQLLPPRNAGNVAAPAGQAYGGSYGAPPPAAPQPQQAGGHGGGGGPDDVPQGEPWLQPAAKQQRRASLGLTWPQPAEFIERCEFISLGCYCGPSRSLQALDVKKYSYPFDWIRSPATGIMHVLDTRFQDFLTYTKTQDQGAVGHLYGNTHWGGSFWHHDPQKDKTKEEFKRRAERLLGLGEVPITKPRVFCWAVNSTRELDDALRLHEKLRNALQNQCQVYLCVLVDLQPQVGPIRVQGRPDVLFCRVSETLFADEGAHWSMEKECEAYAEAIAFAIRTWCGDTRTTAYVKEVPTLRDVSSQMQPFDGGSPALELFFPRRFHGQPISIRRPVSPGPAAPPPHTLPVRPEPRPNRKQRPSQGHGDNIPSPRPSQSELPEPVLRFRDDMKEFAKDARDKMKDLLGGRRSSKDDPERRNSKGAVYPGGMPQDPWNQPAALPPPANLAPAHYRPPY